MKACQKPCKHVSCLSQLYPPIPPSPAKREDNDHMQCPQKLNPEKYVLSTKFILPQDRVLLHYVCSPRVIPGKHIYPPDFSLNPPECTAFYTRHTAIQVPKLGRTCPKYIMYLWDLEHGKLCFVAFRVSILGSSVLTPRGKDLNFVTNKILLKVWRQLIFMPKEKPRQMACVNLKDLSCDRPIKESFL